MRMSSISWKNSVEAGNNFFLQTESSQLFYIAGGEYEFYLMISPGDSFSFIKKETVHYERVRT